MTRYGVWGGYDEEWSESLYIDYSDSSHTIELTDEEWSDYQRVQSEYQAWQKRIEDEKVWQPVEERAGWVERRAGWVERREAELKAQRWHDSINRDCYWHLCISTNEDRYEVDGHTYCGDHAPIVADAKQKWEASDKTQEWWAYCSE